MRLGGLATALLAPAMFVDGAESQGPERESGTSGRGERATFDAIMEQALDRYRVVGGSLSIGRDGRILLARGYGFADLESRQPVRPESRFCIGSVSKAITAAAVLKLVDDGKIDLRTRLVDRLADLKPLPGQSIADLRFREITIHQLLYHSGGFPQDNRAQPGESTPTAKVAARNQGIRGPMTIELLYRVSTGQPLAYTPGTESRYSNFGFVVLQLVVERASGQRFEPFVHEHVLRPMGITRMQMEPLEQRYLPGEVHRYDRGHRKLPGGVDPVSHVVGNWVAPAPALVRFLMAIDGSLGLPFLSARVTELMLATPPPPWQGRNPNRHFGLGWDTVWKTEQGFGYQKNGGKAGVSALIVHHPSGVDWAVAFNTSPEEIPGQPGLLGSVERQINQAIEAEILEEPRGRGEARTK
jgi:N-acyl-D-amino-acid deacylase